MAQKFPVFPTVPTRGGTRNNDVLLGDSNRGNTLVGNGGSDRIVGGRGNDVLVSGDASSFILPTLIPTAPDSVTPPAPTTPAIQPLTGTPSNDTLNGTEQAEIITAGKGSDTIFGNGGNDFFIWNPGDGPDIVHGGVGLDTSVINGGAEGEISMLRMNNGTAVFNRLTQTPFSVTHDGTEVVQVESNEGNDILIADKIAGSGASLLAFSGGGGNDVLFAGTVDTEVSTTGGAGDDILIGGQEMNTIEGGSGNDFLVGNQGMDRFVFSSGKPFNTTDLGVDTITNFNPTQDKIHLSKATFASIATQPGQTLGVSDFARVDSDEAAALSAAKITYVQPTGSSSGKLFYNANGAEAGLGNGAQFAVVAGAPALSDQNFALVA